MKLTIDFETRSACDLKSHGAHVYAEHPTTEILCLAVKVDGTPSRVWINPGPCMGAEVTGRSISLPEIFELMDKADEVEAHNAGGFERPVWEHIGSKRYGWPAIPVHKLRCSMASCAYHGLPMSLDGAGAALGLDVQKDSEGKRLMLRLCKPRRARKNEDPDHLYWHGSREEYERLAEYCMRDTDAEYAVSEAIGGLPDDELAVWQLDQTINHRGILADVAMCKSIMGMLEEDEGRGLERFRKLTHNSVQTVKQIDALLGWLRVHGCPMTGLTKQDVIEALKREDLRPEVREVLRLRQKLALSSVAKFQSVIDRASADGRIRGAFMYHGAGTGRWSGRGVQLQNLPRRSYHAADLGAAACGDIGWFEALGEDLPSTMSTLLRGVFMASSGDELVVADFSSIEARVLAWLAGEEKVLDAFRNHKDLYKVAASGIYSVSYENVDKTQRQIGKVATLALGYQGGVNAFHSMASVYGVRVADDVAQGIVTAWREAHPAIRKFWYDLEQAAMQAVETGRTQTVGRIKYGVRGKFLLCKLPSGRYIHYPFPKVEMRDTKWGQPKRSITWMTSEQGRWVRTHGYGGLLAENATQGAARCFLAASLLRTESAGLPVVLHVHDENGSEVPKGSVEVRDYERLMATPPEWADGCPLAAEGYASERYKK